MADSILAMGIGLSNYFCMKTARFISTKIYGDRDLLLASDKH